MNWNFCRFLGGKKRNERKIGTDNGLIEQIPRYWEASSFRISSTLFYASPGETILLLGGPSHCSSSSLNPRLQLCPRSSLIPVCCQHHRLIKMRSSHLKMDLPVPQITYPYLQAFPLEIVFPMIS